MIEIVRGPGTIAQQLPAMKRMFGRFGIDMTKEPILISPTLHYQNGGIAIDCQRHTAIPNLFVAGEASGGVHGRNRLMGNSLLDVCVFGRRAGVAAAENSQETQLGRLSLEHVRRWEQELKAAGLEDAIRSPILLPDYTRKGVQPDVAWASRTP
jgi:succinate dehydrogenase / fumarate reductase flavoprotein subunit